jgi:hypothetical protein
MRGFELWLAVATVVRVESLRNCLKQHAKEKGRYSGEEREGEI